MNKCVNIVFILLYSETLFEGRNVYVQICKIKNKLCFIYCWFAVHCVELARPQRSTPGLSSRVSRELPHSCDV